MPSYSTVPAYTHVECEECGQCVNIEELLLCPCKLLLHEPKLELIFAAHNSLARIINTGLVLRRGQMFGQGNSR